MSIPGELRIDTVCRLTLDHLHALVRIWTPDRGVVYVNRWWRELTGTTLEGNTGDGWLNTVHDDDRGGLAAAMALGADDAQTTYRLRTRGGAFVPVRDAAASWVDEATRHIHARIHTVTVHEPAAAGDQPDRALAQWAHELRGPLNAILGWSDLLASGANSPDVVQRGLQAIASNARQQAQIIRRMSG